ncbi:hypothetical protein GGR26_001492 [Lewinella marina]|uniref:Uncharacterized protein n=1 Tax=Neolewinella marina TaxID=438751 RepID=A0A2G0CF29_9BACT|nr:hypothetical protein [Neolewinella marina]NJB85747.1 hypothetical protein [Neolewinella marina]PHK98579.1 hypothetical protein CGL56_08885 [Neolewinella marina]
MDIHHFTPDRMDLYATLVGCGAGFLVMVYLAYRASRSGHQDPRQRVLLPMLAYFGALLFLMAFLGSFWTMYKYPDVSIGPDAFVIEGEEMPLPSLNSVRLEAVGRGSNVDQKILLVQTRDRRNWVFPGDRYDINEMYGLLRAYNQR